MTKVFEKIPNDFFKILTSKHKELFLTAIFHLDDLLQGNIYFSRENAINSLQNHFLYLGISIEGLDYEDEYIEEIKNNRELAQSILRQLQKRGWIQINLEEGFTEQIFLPSYTNRFVQLLKEIDLNEGQSYESYVFSTYSALKTGLENKANLLNGLMGAWNATKGLQRAIQSAYFELTKAYSKVIDEASINEMLIQHFVNYKEEIIDQVLYPLKTRDSLPRFKNTILDLLEQYYQEENFDHLLKQNQQKHQTIEESQLQIFGYLNHLTHFYQQVSEQMDKIDQKRVDYTEKSIGKIQYRLRSDYQLKDKIDRLISMIKLQEKESVYQFFNAIETKTIDTESLYKPRKKKLDLTQATRRPVVQESESVENFLAQRETLKMLVNPKYSSRKVDQFILGLLKEKAEISTMDYAIESYDAFILTIMGAIRGYEENKSGYTVIFYPEMIRNGYYGLPKMVFKKERKKK